MLLSKPAMIRHQHYSRIVTHTKFLKTFHYAPDVLVKVNTSVCVLWRTPSAFVPIDIRQMLIQERKFHIVSLHLLKALRHNVVIPFLRPPSAKYFT